MISDIMAHSVMICEIKTFVIEIYFFNVYKMICALMLIRISHYGIKCLRNLILHEPCLVMISDIIPHLYDMWNTIVISINFCNAKKMICALMFIISNHYGIKCLSNLLQLEPCNVMFKVISDIMAQWYDKWNTIVIAMFMISNHYGKWLELHYS